MFSATGGADGNRSEAKGLWRDGFGPCVSWPKAVSTKVPASEWNFEATLDRKRRELQVATERCTRRGLAQSLRTTGNRKSISESGAVPPLNRLTSNRWIDRSLGILYGPLSSQAFIASFAPS